ncbi:hypothetical protein KR009_011135 [Drosophila setifemur]|nr:hypothetical protein KR009_011135 [Drosophila setifemur]
MADSRRNNMGIARLREDMDDIAHLLRRQQLERKDAQEVSRDATKPQFDCVGAEAKMSKGFGKCDHREVNAYVEAMFKRKIGHLMDDLYNLKKQVQTSDCSSRQGQGQGQSQVPSAEPVALAKVRINYAAEELGARVINVNAKPLGGSSLVRGLLGLEFSANPPVNMLRSSLAPGSCFGFSGHQATVTLHLARSIIVEAIALTHVPRELTPSLCVNSAPKDFQVHGLPLNGSKQKLLGQYVYTNAAQKRTQSYGVHCGCFYQSLVLNFTSNHGANSTCIYR